MSEPNEKDQKDRNEHEHDPAPAPTRRRPLWIAVVAALLLVLAGAWRLCA